MNVLAAKSSSTIRYILAALLGGVGIYFVVEMLIVASGKSSSHKPLVCSAPAATYVKVPLYPPELHVELLTFVDDVNFTQRNMGGSLSKFYKGELCGEAGAGNSTDASCSGIVLDVGAFIGTHALLLAKLGFDVHAFEVQEQAAELLRCSKELNGFTNLRITHEAISDAMGFECLLDGKQGGGGTHEAKLAPKHLSGNASGSGCEEQSWKKVPVVTLDHYWKEVLQSQPVHFIKIDVEGHEDLVLQGANELLTNAPPPYMLVEYYHNMLVAQAVDTRALIKRIIGYGYRIYDCEHQSEVQPNDVGLSILEATYNKRFSITDLLLVHKSKYAGDMDLYAKFPCGYVPKKGP